LALLLIVALPLYLWRRPRPVNGVSVDAGARTDFDAGAPDDGGPALAAVEAGVGTRTKLALGDPRTVRCFRSSGGRISAERCDALASVEQSLARAIRENAACAPLQSSAFTVSFVLTVDFDRKTTHLWAGRSGSLRRRNSAELLHCVERSVSPPDWTSTAHEYARYEVNILAAYPGAGGT
jgi:hypothetical protein